MNEVTRKLQEWIQAEERAGRSVDIDRINDRLQAMVQKHNSTPRSDLNGLSPEQMFGLLYDPFGPRCIVRLNPLNEGQYMQIPLVKQALFLMHTLGETELKLTKNGWLPLKIVAETYPLGRPEEIIELMKPKRINEYDAKSVWMARDLLDILGWIKTRKGILSLTMKGRKALTNLDEAAAEIIKISLVGGILHNFDGNENDEIGNIGIAYSVWLLLKYGNEWHSGKFYQERYQNILKISEQYNTYANRVFSRLFYWLGIVDERTAKDKTILSHSEYHATPLLPLLFTIK